MKINVLQAAVERGYGRPLNGNWQKLTGGYECDVWRVAAGDGALVVRVSPAWRTEAELRWVHGLVIHCANSIPEVVAPIVALDGSTVCMVGESPVTVFPFIKGQRLNLEDADLRMSAARLLGRIHRVAQDWIGRLVEKPVASIRDLQLDDGTPSLVDNELDEWHRGLSPSEGLCPIHGDYYRGNLLCDGERICGVIDWDESCLGRQLEEIAWSTWEFSKVPSGDDLDHERAQQFLAAYAEGNPLVDMPEFPQIVPFIRWRLRQEIRASLAAESPDLEYRAQEIRAFTGLKSRL